MDPLVLAIVAVFGTVALISGSVLSYVLARRSPVRQRAAALTGGAAASGVLVDTQRLTNGPDAQLRRLATYIPKSPKEMTRLQRKLALAGYHGTTPVIVYCVGEVA